MRLMKSADCTNLYEDTIKLELGSELDDVSSSKIRENIDRGRDISNLIDPLCQRFIYEYGILSS